MKTRSTIDITLHLDEAEHFFTAPEINPLAHKAVYEPGVDTVFSQVRASRLREAVHLALFLPADRITPSLEQQIKEALNDYCQYKSNGIQQDLNLQWRAGRRALWFGLIFLAVSLVLSGLGGFIATNAANTLAKALGSFMYNGFMIIGWVSLWTPFSMLVFDWWPDWINKKSYERMAKMAIDIRAEPPATGH